MCTQTILNKRSSTSYITSWGAKLYLPPSQKNMDTLKESPKKCFIAYVHIDLCHYSYFTSDHRPIFARTSSNYFSKFSVFFRHFFFVFAILFFLFCNAFFWFCNNFFELNVQKIFPFSQYPKYINFFSSILFHKKQVSN